ncbi:MAG: DUF5011 domain-containing protein, partial [bacterium]|nr:DUF5011 domain-containing protein [bacterium]
MITLNLPNPQIIEVGSPYVELGATASDNYDGDITGSIVTDASAVDTSVVGLYSVTYDVTDANGNDAVQVTRTVDVVDTTAPVITLLGSNPQIIEVGSAYTELGATAADIGDGDLSGSIVIDASGVNTSAVGTYSVTYNVTDTAGNAAAQVTRTVNVVDTVAPIITLLGANPQIIEVGSAYTELGATALDTGDGDVSASIVIDASAVDTSVVGSYLVTYDVTDSEGNAAIQLTRTVDIVDTTIPVITLLGANPQVIEVHSAYTELGATASDNYDGDVSGLIVIDASAVDTSVVGFYLVTYNVTDANGNAATQVTRGIDVVDTTLPVITLVGANPQVIEVHSAYTELGATASDNYDGDLTSSIAIDSTAVDTSVVGSYPVRYNVSDANGNAAIEVTRTVNVVDTTAPVITLLGANPQTIEAGSPYVELGATANDNYDGDITGSIVIDASAVDTGTVGSYLVTYDVTDSEGNPTTALRTVNVVDTTPPVITLAGPNPQVIEVGSPYTELGATATDNHDGDLTSSIVIDASAVTMGVVGSYVVTYNLTDTEGNVAAEVTRTVQVVDTTIPVITLLGANPQLIGVGSPYVELGATASDNYDGDLTLSIVVDSSAVDTSTLGTYTVTYNVTDANGNAAVQRIRTVTVVNVAPTLDAIADQTAAEQTPITFTATATDPDPTDTLSYTLSGAPAGASIDTVSGAFSWTPTEVQGPGSFSFDVVVFDAGTPPLADSQTVTLTVTEVNRAPSLGAVAPQTGDELSVIAFSTPVGDPDIPGNSLTFILSGAPAGASIDPATGDFSWTPAEDQGPGIYVFDVVVSDDGVPSLGDAISVSVTVNEVNANPIAFNPGAQTSAEADVVSLFIASSDVDVPVNTLTYTAMALPDGLSIDSATGEITGTIAYTANASSPYITIVSVTDDGSPVLAGHVSFGWNVADTNRDPVAGDDAYTIVEDTSRTFNVLVDDSDPDGDVVTVTGVGIPANGTAAISGTDIFYAPDANFFGSDSFTYTVADGRGGFATATVTVTVTPDNDVPVLSVPSALDVAELTPATFVATAVDVENDGITFSLVGQPAGASIDPAGTFVWVPNESQGPGIFTFDVVATDSGSPAGVTSQSVTIWVAEVNVAPILVNPGTQVSVEDATVSLALIATDADVPAGTLVFAASGLPSGLSIDSDTGLISGTLPFDSSGASPYTVTVTVTDSGSPQRSDQAVFSWSVANTNRPPVANDITIEAEAGLPTSFALTGSDPDGNTLSYTIATTPGKGSLSGGPRVYSFTPDVAAVGTDSFTFGVSDGSLLATGTVTVVITPNFAPIGGSDEYVTRRGGSFAIEAPGVLGNDRDPEQRDIRVVLETQPAHGFLILNPDGSFSYRNTGDSADMDGFSYRIDDGMRLSPSVNVRIIIEENLAPVVADDVFTVDEDQSVTVEPLANDSDPNDEEITISAVSNGAHGSGVRVSESSISYRPASNWNGVDVVTYTVSDGDLTTSGQVTFIVEPVNDTPNADGAVAHGNSGEVLLVDLKPVSFDVDGDALTYLLEAPPMSSVEQVETGVFAINLDGVIQDLPPLAFVVTDPAGARATALLRVSVTIPAELVGVPSLMTDDINVESGVGGLGNGESDLGDEVTSIVTGLRLMVGSFLGTFRSVRVPAVVLVILLLLSLYLGFSRKFVFSAAATALPLGGKKRVDIVMAPSQAGVPVREEPGSHQSVLTRFKADETGITTTGAQVMVRSEVWVEVETPDGDAWINGEFITEQVPLAVFLDDERPEALVASLVDQIYASGDLLDVTAGHDLHVAHFSPPVRFAANSLRHLLAAASVYWWWNADGDAPSLQATFAETVGETVSSAYRNRGAHHVEPTLLVPVEFVNMH